MRFFDPFLGQGCSLYTDNYYTSHCLAQSLLAYDSHLVGTVRSNRTGFPAALKNVKDLERHGARGDIRYVCCGDIAYVQWLDKRVATILSTKHESTAREDAVHTVRADGAWVQQPVRRPAAIADYNQFMGGADSFDQLASTYTILRRSKKSWRCMFFDLLQCAVINSYLLFAEYCLLHPDVMPRPTGYSQDDFRANLVKQLTDIDTSEPPPVFVPGKKRKHETTPEHLPLASTAQGNCTLCWRNTRREVKTMFSCTTCTNVHGRHLFLCIKKDRQCFFDHHQSL